MRGRRRVQRDELQADAGRTIRIQNRQSGDHRPPEGRKNQN